MNQEKYAEAIRMIATEAKMMQEGDRPLATSVRWLKEAIHILEEECT